jgi:6-phosphogluconolactonase
MEPDRLTGVRSAPRLRAYPDASAVVRAAAAEVLRRGRRALRERGLFDLVLAGGSAPLPLYKALGGRRAALSGLWRRTHLYWSDERVVPPDDPASNYGTAWTSGLDRLGVPEGHVHRVSVEGGEPRRAAVLYEAEIRSRFPGMTWPRFDLVLLGLGTDGHVASLFPGSPALAERERWTTVAEGGEPPLPRVTLTLPVLNSAAAVLLLVMGEGKADVLARLLDPGGETALPAQRLRAARGELLLFTDQPTTRPTGS